MIKVVRLKFCQRILKSNIPCIQTGLIGKRRPVCSIRSGKYHSAEFPIGIIPLDGEIRAIDGLDEIPVSIAKLILTCYGNLIAGITDEECAGSCT